MSDYRRRRRSDESRESGGLPLIPLVLVVIFAGLLLGALLAHFFGGGPGKQPANTTALARATPAFATTAPEEIVTSPAPKATRPPHPTASPSAHASASPLRSASPSTTPSGSPSPSASRTPGASPLPRNTPKPSPHAPLLAAVPSSTPHATAAHTVAPVAATTAPATAAPVEGGSARAASLVRSYLNAVADGNKALATTYLAGGTPGEVFMDQTARIVSLKSNGSAGGYRVSADVVTSNGEYALTFSVAPGASGLQITDHYAIKVR